MSTRADWTENAPMYYVTSQDNDLKYLWWSLSGFIVCLILGLVFYFMTRKKCRTEFYVKNLEIQNEIGGGEFGQVFKYIAKLRDNHSNIITTVVAVKRMKLGSNAVLKENFKQEVELSIRMSKLEHHANIVRFLGAITIGEPKIIMEYCEFDNLKKFLAKHKTFSEYSSPNSLIGPQLHNCDLVGFCWQVSRGMEYLAKHHLVHRDLAARNVLVDKDLVLKICDFGLARNISDDKNYISTNADLPVPTRILAPESVALNIGIFNEKTDVWAFGLLCLEVFTMGDDPQTENMENLQRPDLCSDEIFYIVKSCINRDPDTRPSFFTLTEKLYTYVGSEMVNKIFELDAAGFRLEPSETDPLLGV